MKPYVALFSAQEKDTSGTLFYTLYERMVPAFDVEDAIKRIRKSFEAKKLRIFGFRSVAQHPVELL